MGIAVWKSDLVGSDIDPLHGVLGERAANHGWGPWFLRNLALRRHHPIYPGNTSPVTDPKRTKPNQRHKQGSAKSRTRRISLPQLIEELALYLRGWRGCFGFCQTPRVLSNLEAWIRRRFVSLAAVAERAYPLQ